LFERAFEHRKMRSVLRNRIAYTQEKLRKSALLFRGMFSALNSLSKLTVHESKNELKTTNLPKSVCRCNLFQMHEIFSIEAGFVDLKRILRFEGIYRRQKLTFYH
jgi:hypothetical protein